MSVRKRIWTTSEADSLTASSMSVLGEDDSLAEICQAAGVKADELSVVDAAPMGEAA